MCKTDTMDVTEGGKLIMLDSVILKIKDFFDQSILLQLCMEPEYHLTPEETIKLLEYINSL